MNERDQARAVLARARRLLRRANAMGRKAVAVLCSPKVRGAERSAVRAGELVEEALRLASGPALSRLGLPQDAKHVLPHRFVDEASWVAVRRLEQGLLRGRVNYIDVAFPRRWSFEESLVRAPNEAVREFERVAGLAPDSAELRNLQATIEERPPERTGRRRSRRRDSSCHGSSVERSVRSGGTQKPPQPGRAGVRRGWRGENGRRNPSK